MHEILQREYQDPQYVKEVTKTINYIQIKTSFFVISQKFSLFLDFSGTRTTVDSIYRQESSKQSTFKLEIVNF